MQSMLSKLENSNRERVKEVKDMWKLNNTFLNSDRSKKQKGELKILWDEWKQTKKKPKSWDPVKMMFRGKFIAIIIYIKEKNPALITYILIVKD